MTNSESNSHDQTSSIIALIGEIRADLDQLAVDHRVTAEQSILLKQGISENTHHIGSVVEEIQQSLSFTGDQTRESLSAIAISIQQGFVSEAKVQPVS